MSPASGSLAIRKQVTQPPLPKTPYLRVNLATMLTKRQLKETLEQFPEEFTLDELIDKIIFLDKIERGNQQSERGETITEDELEKEMQKW